MSPVWWTNNVEIPVCPQRYAPKTISASVALQKTVPMVRSAVVPKAVWNAPPMHNVQTGHLTNPSASSIVVKIANPTRREPAPRTGSKSAARVLRHVVPAIPGANAKV